MSAGAALERVEEALREHGCRSNGHGQWCCPAHEDKNPSLSVSQGKSGVVLHCHGPCSVNEIVSALGLQMADLFDERREPEAHAGKPDRSWEIRDAEGRVIALHHRKNLSGDRKRVWWATPDGRLGLGGCKVADLPLYGVDRLGMREPGDDAPVIVCEGEPATDALFGLGLRAVGTVTGASSVPSAASLAPLAGSDIALWPDADEVGRSHMDRIAALLEGIAASVRIFAPDGLSEGGDAADWTAAHAGVPNLATELIAAIESEARAVEPQSPTFEPLVDDVGYRLSAPALAAALEVSHLRRERHQLRGEVLVRCTLPGAATFDGVLSVSDVNLSSSRSRSEYARHLAEQAHTEEDLWRDVVEELAQRVLAAERAGEPAVQLREIPRARQQEILTVEGLPLLGRHPVFLFGDGGTGKSFLALFIAGTLAQRGLRVALFDWELVGEDHRDRLERLFGPEMPAIAYARCARPLFHEAERLRRIVRDHWIQYAVFDSVAFACDGPPEAAEVAARYFQALRQLGEIGSLHVCHVTKAAEGADQKPFGSVFWANGARATWNLKLAEQSPEESRITLGLYNRKANLGGLRSAVGLELIFGPERTAFRRVDLADSPDLAAHLSVRQRMAAALRRGALTPERLAEEVDAKVETIKRTARRYGRQFVLVEGGLLGLREGQA